MKRQALLEKQSKFVNDLYLFYRYFVASDYRDDVPAPHIKELSKHLTKLKLGKGKHRLAVSMPPRHSKSSMVTIAFPLWLIFQDPNLNILIVAGPGLSEKFGISIREYVTRYGKHFGCYLSDVKQSSTYIMFCNENNKLFHGSIRLTGPEGAITGQDVDYLIVDDPYKGLDEELTQTALKKKIDWANRVLEQRIEPQTRYCILHTRWHTNDLIGHYMKTQADDFTFVSYPAIKEDNTPLWKERYTLEMLLKKKENIKDRLFSSIYQQKPLDETSDFFNVNKINWFTPEGNIEDTVRSWDIAGRNKNKKNDFTAGSLDHRVDEKKFLCNNLVHGQFAKETKNRMLDTARLDTPGVTVAIETGIAAAGGFLFDEWEKQFEGYHVEQSNPIGSKEDRATPFKNAMEDGLVYIDLPEGPERQTLINELRSFPYGEHDDVVDSLSYGYNYLFMRNDDKPEYGGPDLLYLDI